MNGKIILKGCIDDIVIGNAYHHILDTDWEYGNMANAGLGYYGLDLSTADSCISPWCITSSATKKPAQIMI